jgi:site-specific DNA recombinase
MLGGRAVRELVLHPENSGVVRALYQRYAGGTGFLSLTRWLNETGVPTQNGGLWLTATVRQILRNPFYAGYGTSRTYRVDTPARGNHPAIIPDDLWQEVRRMREARSSLPRRQQSTDYTLTGVLYCGVCGHTMGGTWFKSGSGDQVYRYQVYRCLSFRCGRYCGNRNHRVEDIEAAFIDELEQRLGQPSELRTLLEEQSAAAASRLEEYEAGRRRTLNRIKEIDQALQRVKRAYFEADTLTDQEYAATKAEYTAERQRLENEFSRPAPAAEVRDLSGLAEQVRQIRANWAYLTPEERKTFALNITKGYGLKAIVMPDKSVRLEAE